jgi:DNA polymerase-3 subunit delta'
MTLREVRGQEAAVASLERALRAGRLHHALRFEGPEGTGRELAALGVAQALLCDERATSGAGEAPLGCGRCDACVRVVTTTTEPPHVPRHLDVIVVDKGLYPELEKAKTAIGVEQIRHVVLRHREQAPHGGRARVFVVRAAEDLNTSAANALLKMLEEPPRDTYFILLTSKPSRLLSTVRSRSLPVRFRPLPDPVLRSLLLERGVDEARLDEVLPLAGGSVTAALALLDPERAEQRRAFVDRALAAATAGTAAAAVDLGEAFGSIREEQGGRERLVDAMHALAAALVARARRGLDRDPRSSEALARAHELVLAATTSLEGSASPAMLLARLALDLHPILGPHAS